MEQKSSRSSSSMESKKEHLGLKEPLKTRRQKKKKKQRRWRMFFFLGQRRREEKRLYRSIKWRKGEMGQEEKGKGGRSHH